MPTDSNLANVAALADGLANSAVNNTTTDGGSNAAVGVANAADSNNTSNSNNDSSTNTSDSSNSTDNGDNRGNSYDWNSTVNTAVNTATTANNSTATDTHVKDSNNSYSDSNTTTRNNGNTRDSNNSDSSSHTKDSFNLDSSSHTKDSFNSNSSTNDSYNTDSSSHYDLGSLKGVSNEGAIGIAGGDLNFHLGPDYSFNLNLDNILNNSLGGDGNNTGFSLVQANNLADQDQAYNISMDNSGAHNSLHAIGGDATGAAGVGYDASFDHHANPGSSDNSVGHDQSGSSTTDATAIISNSGFHQEIVQGANMVSNAADIAITGGNDHHDTTSTT